MIYDLHFVSDSKLCVLAEDALSFYDLDGNLLGSFSYGESYLKDYTTDGSGCLTLVMNLYQAGNRYTVLTVGYDGAELGRLSSGEQILDISAAGKYLAILTSSSLSIYDQTLQEYDVSDNTAGAASVVMRCRRLGDPAGQRPRDPVCPVKLFPKIVTILQRYDCLSVIYSLEAKAR